MAYAYKNPKSGRFILGWVDEYGRPQRKTAPGGVRTLTEARRIAEDKERQAWRVREGLEQRPTPDMSLKDAVELYLASLPPDYSSRKDLAGRLRNYVAKELGHMMVRELKPVDVMQMLGRIKKVRTGKPLSAQTRENTRMAGQGLYTFLIEKAKVHQGSNPFKDVEPVRVPKREVRFFEPQHLPVLFRELKKHYVAICAFALFTGVRRGELRVLLKKNVRLEQRYVLIQSGGRRETTKGGRERRVPIPEVLVPVVNHQLRATLGPYLFPRPGTSEPFGAHWRPHDVIRRACVRAGLPTDLRLKHLRSTWGTASYAATGDIRLVQELLGHEDVATTEAHYAHAQTAHLQRGANQAAEVLGRALGGALALSPGGETAGAARAGEGNTENEAEVAP